MDTKRNAEAGERIQVGPIEIVFLAHRGDTDGNLDLYEGSDRLLARLGVALGAVYLAMFTIWVALTRARWNGGPRLRG